MADHATSGKFDPSHWDKINIEKNLMFIKGWEALGAFDPDERKRALDLLGFNRQLVFTSLAMGQFLGVFEQREYDPNLLYGGADALNRAISDFCKDDKRMIPVGFLPLDDARRAERTIDEGLKTGLRHLLDSANPAGDKSPTHHAFDGVWGRSRTQRHRSCSMWVRARRRCPTPIEQRPRADYRFPRRRRGARLEGLHDAARAGRGLPECDGARRDAGAVPRLRAV